MPSRRDEEPPVRRPGAGTPRSTAGSAPAVPGSRSSGLEELLDRFKQPQDPPAPLPDEATEWAPASSTEVPADWPDLSTLVTDAVDEMLRREVAQYGLEGGVP